MRSVHLARFQSLFSRATAACYKNNCLAEEHAREDGLNTSCSIITIQGSKQVQLHEMRPSTTLEVRAVTISTVHIAKLVGWIKQQLKADATVVQTIKSKCGFPQRVLQYLYSTKRQFQALCARPSTMFCFAGRPQLEKPATQSGR